MFFSLSLKIFGKICIVIAYLWGTFLCLACWVKKSADNNLKYLKLLSAEMFIQKRGFDLSCEFNFHEKSKPVSWKK